MAERVAGTQTAATEALGLQVGPTSGGGRLLVVTIDRLPAWILSAYGSTWVSMPALDAMAGRGIVFDGFVATGTDPQAVIADLLDGVLVPAAMAGKASVVTDDAAVAILAGKNVEARLVEPPPPATAVDEGQTGLARLLDAAAETVAAGRHALVWCHAGSLGWAWDAPDEFRAAYVDPDDPVPPPGAAVPDIAVTADTDPDVIVGIRQIFAGQITLLDRRLARLLAAAEGWTVLVVGVRGLPLGLHGRVGCGPLPPYGELVRLPAILVDAAGRMAGQRYGGLVTPSDFGATLAELAAGMSPEHAEVTVGAASESPLRGRSLAGLFRDWSVAVRDRVIVTTPAGIAVVTPHWHLIVSATAEEGEPWLHLFAKPDDFFELCDVANRCPDVVEPLRGIAEAAAAGAVERAWQAPLGRSGGDAG